MRASVSRQPISDLEKLKLVVKYLEEEPRIMVLVDGSIGGDKMDKNRANEIAGRIGLKLEESGFLIVVPESTLEDEAAADTMQNVDFLVRATINVNVMDRVEGAEGKMAFPVISAMTTGVFRVIDPGTSEVLFSFDHDALPPDRKDEIKGFGNTDDKAIANSIGGFIFVSAEKLAWEMAAKLGELI